VLNAVYFGGFFLGVVAGPLIGFPPRVVRRPGQAGNP
jgi:hypothetical protein